MVEQQQPQHLADLFPIMAAVLQDREEQLERQLRTGAGSSLQLPAQVVGPPAYVVQNTFYTLNGVFSRELVQAVMHVLSADTITALAARAGSRAHLVDWSVPVEAAGVMATLLEQEDWHQLRRYWGLQRQQAIHLLQMVLDMVGHYLPRHYRRIVALTPEQSDEEFWDADGTLALEMELVIRRMFAPQSTLVLEPAPVEDMQVEPQQREEAPQPQPRPTKQPSATPPAAAQAAQAPTHTPGAATHSAGRAVRAGEATAPERAGDPMQVDAPVQAPPAQRPARRAERREAAPGGGDDSSSGSSKGEGPPPRRSDPNAPVGVDPLAEDFFRFLQWRKAGKPRTRSAVIQRITPNYRVVGTHISAQDQLVPLFTLPMPTTRYPEHRSQWGSAEARTFLNNVRKYWLNRSLMNAEGHRLVSKEGEPDQCISLLLHLFPTELQHRIRAAGVEMAEERAAALHPHIAEGTCTEDAAMDYLTFRELELIVYQDEGKATKDEVKRKLKRLRYNGQLSWTANYNMWYPLVRQLQYSDRRRYNSLAVFIDSHVELSHLMFGKPGRALREVVLESDVTQVAAKAALDAILAIGRQFEADNEKLADWRKDNAIQAKASGITAPPVPPVEAARAQAPAERQLQPRRTVGFQPSEASNKRRPDEQRPPRDPSHPAKKPKQEGYTIIGGEQSWERMRAANPNIPPGIKHLLPKWFKGPARDKGGLCCNCWGKFHGDSACDASQEVKDAAAEVAKAALAKVKAANLARDRQRYGDRMDVDGASGRRANRGWDSGQGRGGGDRRGRGRGPRGGSSGRNGAGYRRDRSRTPDRSRGPDRGGHSRSPSQEGGRR